MRRNTTWAVVVMAVVGLAACGGDDDAEAGPSTADTAVDAAGDTAGAATTAVAVSDTDSASTMATVTAVTTAATSSAEEAGGDGDDGCTVTITGAMEASWSSAATGLQVLVVGDWLANPGPEDAGTFGFNCYDEDFNIVGFTSSPIVDIPAEPATFALTDEVDPPISADVAVLTDEGAWSATSGVLELVEFDDTHVRGTFSFDIADDFDPTRVAHVEGSFSYDR